MGIIRKTRSVSMVLDEFQMESTAISTVNLIKRLDSKLNKTTIYRILDKLEDDGVLHSFTGRKGVKWYAKCTNYSEGGRMKFHPHFQCINCNKVECLSLDIKIPEIPNHQVKTSQILIQGKCEICSE